MSYNNRPTSSRFLTRTIVAAIAVLLVSNSIPQMASGQNRIETIVISGDVAPDGNGTFLAIDFPSLNNLGQLSFSGVLTDTTGGSADERGIYRADPFGLTQIVRGGQLAPDFNGSYSYFPRHRINDLGQVAFAARLVGTSGGLGDDYGFFRGSGDFITQVLREDQDLPDLNGQFDDDYLVIDDFNNLGQFAFKAPLRNTSGGTSDNAGVYQADGLTLIEIARKGMLSPDSNGSFLFFHVVTQNNQGHVAFSASLDGTEGGVTDDTGVYFANGNSLVQIAREGQSAPGGGTFGGVSADDLNDSGQIAMRGFFDPNSSNPTTGLFRATSSSITQIVRDGQTAPDGNGTFNGIFESQINSSGVISFFAYLDGTVGGSLDNQGLFAGDGIETRQIARTGQAVANGNGQLNHLFVAVTNNSGQTAFVANLRNTAGGSSDDDGLFISDGIDLVEITRKGQTVDDSPIRFLALSSSSINDLGQVAYYVDLESSQEAIQLFTPDLHYRQFGTQLWDDPGNWTLSIAPGFVHDVFIDPAGSTTVYGPSNQSTVRKLQIGGQTGIATFQLVNGGGVVANEVNIMSTGVLTGDGFINAQVNNFGTVLADNITLHPEIPLYNWNVIEGDGRIHGNIVNQGSGEIRVTAGQRMQLTGPNLTNDGVVNVVGGRLEVDGNAFNNAGTGLIYVRDASLHFGEGLANNGSIGFSFGTSDFFGDIENSTTGIINISGGSQVTFLDDLNQGGTMQVVRVGDSNSVAVLFGEFSGLGGFTGGGDVFALGDLRPGASPASVLMDGNLFLGASTNTFVELAGTAIGDFDQLVVTGDLGLAGVLNVDLIDAFQLSINDHFVIADVEGTLTGQFIGLDEGDWVGNFGGQNLFISYAAGDGNDVTLFTAVPEVNSFGLLLFGLVSLFAGNRRRRI